MRLRKLRKDRELEKEAKKLIGEADDLDPDVSDYDPKKVTPSQHKRNLSKLARDVSSPDERPAPRPTDAAVVIYPEVVSAIPMSGPINPTQMMMTFFREDAPSLFPEVADVMNSMSVKDMCEIALDHGMTVLFGKNGKLDQILTKNPSYVIRNENDASVVKQVFPIIEDNLVWLSSLNYAEPELVPSREALGQGLISWKKA